MSRLVVTADDFGLTRSINDTILVAVDQGALTQVSLLANGLDFDYAIERLKERPALGLAVHLNVTEGTALTPPHEAPHLLTASGQFRFSSTGYLLRSIFLGSTERQQVYKEIHAELARQIGRVRQALPARMLAVDGHQHVHMAPLVCAALLELHKHYGFAAVRLPYEPLFFDLGSWRGYARGLVRHLGLNILARRARKQFAAAGIAHTDFFVGTLMSGRLTRANVCSALLAGQGSAAEVGTHPGTALAGELTAWTGDIAWHYSPWRERERAMLTAGDFPRELAQQRAPTWRRGAKFAAVGSVAFGLHFLVLYVLTEWAGWWYLYATTAAWVVAFIFSFTTQKLWTFGDTGLKGAARQMRRYFALQGVNIALNAAGMYVLVDYAHLWYMAAQVCVALVIAVWTYTASHLIFRSA